MLSPRQIVSALLLLPAAFGFLIRIPEVAELQRPPPLSRLFHSSPVKEQQTTEQSTDSTPTNNPVILFDGVCNFCNAWVDILLRIDVNAKFKFAPLQSETGRRLLTAVGKQADDISSVVLVQPDLQYFDKSACVLQVVRELGPVAAVASNSVNALVPKQLRDNIYDTVAENRYNFLGKRDECRCGDPRYADRFLM